MDTIKRWESRMGCLLWLDYHATVSGEPYLLNSEMDVNGKTKRETWCVKTADGYLMQGEE